jgi:predicted nucleotidyltransferase
MPVGPKEAARYLRERDAAEQKALDVRFSEMTRDAGTIVAAIAEYAEPVRIYQWGSLLDRKRFRSYSDIDIAVEGIADPVVWSAVEKLAWESTDFPLDLVQLEHVEPEYAELIRQKGRVVYERSK